MGKVEMKLHILTSANVMICRACVFFDKQTRNVSVYRFIIYNEKWIFYDTKIV